MPRKPASVVSDNTALVDEWNYQKNDSLGYSPDKIGSNSHIKIWWQCAFGHDYDMTPAQRTRGQGCPYCSGRRVLSGVNDLATAMPEVLQFWDYKKNEIKPEEVFAGTSKSAWWLCPKGHSYKMGIKKKTTTNLTSCPICNNKRIKPGVNDLATLQPALAKQWHPTKNGALSPDQISKQSGKKVWWICEYGHEWQATPNDRVGSKTGCPECAKRRATSFPEQAIFFYVKKLYPSAINRCKDLFTNGMELDIYIPEKRLAIEYDGAHWHEGEGVHKKEKEKRDLCRKHGITLIRVKETADNRWRDVSDQTFYIRRKNRDDLQVVIQLILDDIDPDSNHWTRRTPQFHSSIHVNLERDEAEIKEYLTPIPNSLEKLRPELVNEWNWERNGNLRPEMFGINSNDRVWWRCSICGHEWKTSIISRGGKRNSGCPECAKEKNGKTFTAKRVAERGSLAENNPKLAAEWHPTKNGELKPTDITEKRFKPVWWLCPICGYEWEASPNNRAKGVGCPCCSGRVPKSGVNDLKTLYPEIAAEWDYDRNNGMKPEDYKSGSGQKVWWKCKKCGDSWEAIIANRTKKGSGCPYCSGRRKRAAK